MATRLAASILTALCVAGSLPSPVAAQPVRRPPVAAGPNNGIKVMPNNGIKSGTPPDAPSSADPGAGSGGTATAQPPQDPQPQTQAQSANQPLIAPMPDKMTEELVLGTLKTMQFSILPHGKSNILVAYGPVDNDVATRFRAALDAARPVEEVWLYSGGGNLGQGLEVGRILHSRKIATHIVKGMRCISACNFMFMGGIIRYIDPGATIEVHMFSDDSAQRLLHDMVRPPKTLRELARRYPTVNPDLIVEQMSELFPKVEINAQMVRAAKTRVMQDARVDSGDNKAFGLAVIDTIISDYNTQHPDSTIDEAEIIARLTLSEDVKGIQMDSAQVAAEIARYLTEMSLSLKFLTRFADLHNDTPTRLTRAELREFNVINTD